MSEFDAELEALSDKIRMGEPVGFWQAIAVVDYQARLRNERLAAMRKTRMGRLRLWLKSLTKGQP